MAGSNIPHNIKPYLVEASRKYHIPARVIAGLLDVESNFQALGTNSSGYGGISQMGASESRQYTPRHTADARFNVRQGILGAANYLVALGYHKHPLFALGAYNGGPGNPQLGYAHQVLQRSRDLAHQIDPWVQGKRAGTGATAKTPSAARGPSLTASGGSTGGVDYTTATQPVQHVSAGVPEPAFSARRNLAMPAGYTPLTSVGAAPTQTTTSLADQLTQAAGVRGPDSTVTPGKTVKPAGKGSKLSSSSLHTITGKGLTPGRTDQGYDQGGQGYLLALGSGKITWVDNASGWPGGHYMVLQLDRPHNGKRYVYYAEHITPVVKEGQRVRAGDRVAFQHAGYPYSESGWASGPRGNTLASARGHVGPSPGHYSPEGRGFAGLIGNLNRRR